MALSAGDPGVAGEALTDARALDALVDEFDEALRLGRETARLSPRRRILLADLERYGASFAQVDFAVRDTRVLARHAVRLARSGEPIDPALPEAVRELGLARVVARRRLRAARARRRRPRPRAAGRRAGGRGGRRRGRGPDPLDRRRPPPRRRPARAQSRWRRRPRSYWRPVPAVRRRAMVLAASCGPLFALLVMLLVAPALAQADWNGDGPGDVLTVHPDGRLLLYRGNGAGGWLTAPGGESLGGGWGAFTALLAPGDFSGDGKPDLLVRDKDGRLLMYRGDGAGGWSGTPQTVGFGLGRVHRAAGARRLLRRRQARRPGPHGGREAGHVPRRRRRRLGDRHGRGDRQRLGPVQGRAGRRRLLRRRQARRLRGRRRRDAATSIAATASAAGRRARASRSAAAGRGSPRSPPAATSTATARPTRWPGRRTAACTSIAAPGPAGGSTTAPRSAAAGARSR